MRAPSSCLLAAAAALTLPGLALADGCDAVASAVRKLDTLPYRMHTVTLAAEAGSEPEVGDMIATGDKLYFGIDGDWQSVPRDRSGLGQLDADLGTGDVRCRALPDAVLDGVPTAVWGIDDEAQPDLTAQSIWIARDSGLILRVEQALDEGVGDAGKSRITIDFSFDDVAAPAGVE